MHFLLVLVAILVHNLPVASAEDIEQPNLCPLEPEPEMPAWMEDLRNITIYGDQLAAFVLYPLGEL